MGRPARQSATRCPPPCGKARYPTRKAARKAVKQLRYAHDKQRAYQCDLFPQFWHNTSQDADTVTWYRNMHRPADPDRYPDAGAPEPEYAIYDYE